MGRAMRGPRAWAAPQSRSEARRIPPRAGEYPRRPELMPLSASARQLWKPLLLAAAVAFAYWGVLARLGRFWWEDENYSHGLLIPFIIGYILWAGRGRLARTEKRPRAAWGAACAALALLALWAGTAGAELFVQR